MCLLQSIRQVIQFKQLVKNLVLWYINHGDVNNNSMIESDCCGSSEWLEDTGICGACGEHADFNEIEDEA